MGVLAEEYLIGSFTKYPPPDVINVSDKEGFEPSVKGREDATIPQLDGKIPLVMTAAEPKAGRRRECVAFHQQQANAHVYRYVL